MCTSFAVYKNKPIYAMNFDCWNVESRIRIDHYQNVATFCFEVNLGGIFLETAGMNSYGFFGNFQGNLSDKHQNIAPGSDCITIKKLYLESLHSAKSIADFHALLGEKTVVYPPVPPEYNKLHNMFAAKNGTAIILETANGENDMTTIHSDFLIMTNFPAGQFKNMDYLNIYGAGSDRYRKAYEYISTHPDFNVTNAFEVLKNTIQQEANWETLTSMVFVPDELAVYIIFKRNFDKIWRVDIEKKRLETFHGFVNRISMDMSDAPLVCSDLQSRDI